MLRKKLYSKMTAKEAIIAMCKGDIVIDNLGRRWRITESSFIGANDNGCWDYDDVKSFNWFLKNVIECYLTEEVKEPKFTPENIRNIWCFLDGGSLTFTNNVLTFNDRFAKSARLATPEEIQAECDRLNKLCEEK